MGRSGQLAATRAQRCVLVLLPGMDGTGALLRDFSRALAAEFDVRIIDYPPDVALDYRQLEARIRKALPRKAPFVIVGESFSGPIALSIAASPPAGMRAVVLCASFACNPFPWLRKFRALLRFAPIQSRPGWLSAKVLLGRWTSPSRIGELARAVAPVTAEVMRARLAAVVAVDLRDRLGAIAMPLLYLRASEDRLIPSRAGALIGAALPSASLVDIVGPHFLLQVAPHECAQALTEFVHRHGA